MGYLRDICLQVRYDGNAQVLVERFFAPISRAAIIHRVRLASVRMEALLPIAIALFQAQRLTEWGQVFAASIVALIPVVLVFVIFQRYFIRGIAATGLKG